MTIAIVASQSASTDSVIGTLTFPGTATANNLLVCAVAWCNDTGTTTGVTCSIPGWTEAIQLGRSGNGANQMNGAAIFYKIADGTETSVTPTLTGDRKWAAQFAEYSGVTTSSPLDKTSAFDQASLVNSIQPGSTGTLSQADEVAICAAGWGDDEWTGDSWSGDFAETSAMHQVGGTSTDLSLALAYDIVSSTTALNPTHSVTGLEEDAIAAIATFKAAGGGATGTGDLVGAGSEVVGTGTRTVTGAGALEGQGAAVVGTGERVITGTGALIGQGSDVSGTGATGGVHTGTGDLVGAGSEIVGVGYRTVTGTGALLAQGSAVVGVGERTIIGSGDLVGAGADVSGSGAVGGITTGTGDLVGAGSEIVGTGLRTVTGSGALVAQGSVVTGTGERTVTGAGALIGSGSEIVGAGVGGDVTTGAGALVGQGSAVTGTGKRTITGIGDLVAAGSIIVGAGVRTITGSGALVGAGSEVVGSYVEEDCTEVPSYTQFDEPVNALHEAILSQFGEDVTFSGIGLTATAVFKRYKDDVPGGGARPGVPRDVLRIKQTDICAYDVDHGTAVTVRGQAYKVISIERTKHGMTHLGIRRTH